MKTKRMTSGVSWDRLVGLVFVSVGLLAGGRSLSDNSLLTHIATGRYIWDNKSVPVEDIYSFTANGTPWVVQSWMVSALYGFVDAVAGGVGIRIVGALCGAAIMGLAYWLIRNYTIKQKIVLLAVPATTAVLVWSSRPNLFGLLFVVLCVFAARRTTSSWWMIICGVIWVNTHGSWPIGIATLLVVAFADWLDKNSDTGRGVAALKTLGWLTVGCVAGATLGPLGFGSILFPLMTFERSEQLGQILEWKSFRITSPIFVFLVFQAIFTIMVLKKITKGDVVIIIFSLCIALWAVRNITVANFLLLIPVIKLVKPAKIPSLKTSRVATIAVAILMVSTTVMFLLAPTWNFEKYPTEAVEHLKTFNMEELRVFASVSTNNYIELAADRQIQVFVDDRFDMYPINQIDDYLLLIDPNITAEQALEVFNRYSFNAAVLPKKSVLAKHLVGAGWQIVFSDEQWVVLV